jgi:hypothetical protein
MKNLALIYSFETMTTAVDICHAHYQNLETFVNYIKDDVTIDYSQQRFLFDRQEHFLHFGINWVKTLKTEFEISRYSRLPF